MLAGQCGLNATLHQLVTGARNHLDADIQRRGDVLIIPAPPAAETPAFIRMRAGDAIATYFWLRGPAIDTLILINAEVSSAGSCLRMIKQNLSAVSVVIAPELWSNSMLPEGILERWIAPDRTYIESGKPVAVVRIEGARHYVTAPCAGRLDMLAKVDALVEPGAVIARICVAPEDPHAQQR